MRSSLLASLTTPAHGQTVAEQVRVAVRARADTLRTVSYQQGREEQTDRQTKTIRIGSDGELALGNIAGDIVVTRANGSDATIDIVKTARARTVEEAREQLSMVTVNVTERNGRAEVKTVYPNDDNRRNNRRNFNVSVAYTVSTPAGTRLTISSISGSIRVTDIKGDLSANSISGAVHIANGGRIAAAKSISGDVEIVDTQTDGAIEVQSISGSVLLRKVTARRLDIGSVSGSVACRTCSATGSRRTRSAAVSTSRVPSPRGADTSSTPIPAMCGSRSPAAPASRSRPIRSADPFALTSHSPLRRMRTRTAVPAGARCAASSAMAARFSISPPSPATSSSASASAFRARSVGISNALLTAIAITPAFQAIYAGSAWHHLAHEPGAGWDASAAAISL